MKTRLLLFSLLLVLLFFAVTVYADDDENDPEELREDNDAFRQLFPGYREGILDLLNNTCKDLYEGYLTNKNNVSALNKKFEKWRYSTLLHETIECVLDNTPELVKFKFAAAQVILGLSPGVLAMLGPSPQETALLWVVARRPLLAWFVAAASPAVLPMRSVDYTRVIQELTEHRLSRPKRMFFGKDTFIILAEYLVAAGAIANTAYLAYSIGFKTFFAVFPNDEWPALIWATLGTVIHILGAMALALRVRVRPRATDGKPVRRTRMDYFRDQFKPLDTQCTAVITVRDESHAFFFLSWLTGVTTVCHIIFGTIIFSSILFVSVNDAVGIIGRFMLSVVAARLILTYELSIFRSVFEPTSISREATGLHG